MANPLHLNILKMGVNAWNEWRFANPNIQADLRGADLRGWKLRRANLRRANLFGADLFGADLFGVDLEEANLEGADLRVANLRGAKLRGAELRGANLIGAKLIGAKLIGANLRGAKLRGAELNWADLRGAELRGADLTAAKLKSRTDSFGAVRDFVDLSYADNLKQAQIDLADGDTGVRLPVGLQHPKHWPVVGQREGAVRDNEEAKHVRAVTEELEKIGNKQTVFGVSGHTGLALQPAPQVAPENQAIFDRLWSKTEDLFGELLEPSNWLYGDDLKDQLLRMRAGLGKSAAAFDALEFGLHGATALGHLRNAQEQISAARKSADDFRLDDKRLARIDTLQMLYGNLMQLDAVGAELLANRMMADHALDDDLDGEVDDRRKIAESFQAEPTVSNDQTRGTTSQILAANEADKLAQDVQIPATLRWNAGTVLIRNLGTAIPQLLAKADASILEASIRLALGIEAALEHSFAPVREVIRKSREGIEKLRDWFRESSVDDEEVFKELSDQDDDND